MNKKNFNYLIFMFFFFFEIKPSQLNSEKSEKVEEVFTSESLGLDSVQEKIKNYLKKTEEAYQSAQTQQHIFQEKLKNLKDRFEKLNDKKNNYLTEIEKLKTQNKDLNLKIEELQTKINQLEINLPANIPEILKKEFNSNLTKIEENSKKIENLETAKGYLKEEIKETVKNSKKLSKEIKDLEDKKEEYDSLTSEIKKLWEDAGFSKDFFRTNTEINDQTIEKFKKEIKDKEEEIKIQKEEEIEMQKKVQNFSEKSTELEKKNKELNYDLKLLTENLEDLKKLKINQNNFKENIKNIVEKADLSLQNLVNAIDKSEESIKKSVDSLEDFFEKESYLEKKETRPSVDEVD